MTAAQFVARSACINCGSASVREISGGLFNEAPFTASFRLIPGVKARSPIFTASAGVTSGATPASRPSTPTCSHPNGTISISRGG